MAVPGKRSASSLAADNKCIGTTAAPAYTTPNQAAAASALFSVTSATRSPRPTPCAANARATSQAIPCSALKLIAREVIRRNGVRNGLVYMQVTRGVAPRDHKFPAGVRPSVVMTAREVKPHSAKMLAEGVAVVSVPDIRWARCDIKSVALLPNVLAKQTAAEAGAQEAWQVDGGGRVPEGRSARAWIVTGGRRVVARAAMSACLNGVSRPGCC